MGYYKPKNSPYYHYSFKLHGKPQARGSTGTTDKKLAEAYYHKVRTEAYENVNFKKDSKIKISDLLLLMNKNRWHLENLDWYLKGIIDAFGNLNAADLQLQMLHDYSKKRLKDVSPASINKEMALLAAAYNYAIKAKMLFENPVKEFKRFDCTDRAREKFLTPEEKMLLIGSAEGTLQDLIVFALQTGMRQGEILGLKWSDVDLALKQIKVVSKKGMKTIVRRVPIFNQVEEILRSRPRAGEFVFSYKDGRPLSRLGVVHSSYQRLIKKTGIQGGNFTFHDLRHTFASDFLMAGNSLSELQTILGHRRHDTTRRYAHLSREHLKMTMARLPKIVYERKPEESLLKAI